MLDFCGEGRGFDPRPGQVRRFIRSIHVVSNVNMSLISSDSRSPRNSRTSFNVEKENVTGYTYIAHLYCLEVQAGFYSDVVEY